MNKPEHGIPFPTSNNGHELAEYARKQVERAETYRFVSHGFPPDSLRGYTLISQIHSGGQGEVYEAIQSATKRKVAVKVMYHRALANDRSRARFEQEMEILGKLKHPNIVAVHDGGVSASGRYFLVTDLIDGEPLDEWLFERQATVRETLSLFKKICDAVNAAHVHGIAHRDLKPSNILVDGSGEPYVLDFGLAKLVWSEIETAVEDRTCEGEFLGSIPWASPEQAECAPGLVDLRTDVYSLGVVLFHVLTGQNPYGIRGHLPEVLSNIRSVTPVRPSTIRVEIDDDVDTIVLKCLSKERERRYQTAGELSRDIESYLAGKPIDAKRDSTWYVLSRTMRHHRRVAATAIAFVSLIAFGLVVATSLYFRSVSAERNAKRKFEQAQGLARAFLFDLDGKLREGPTAAREFYVGTALDYLESLAEETRTDADVQEMLIAAYVKVADVQGNESYANLGDAPGAMQTLETARAFAESAVASFPEREGLRRELATVYERIGDLHAYLRGHGTEEALRSFERSLGLRETLAARCGDDPESIRDLASVLMRMGNQQKELGRFEEAVKTYDRSMTLRRRRIELEPDSREAQLYFVRGLRTLGDVRYELGAFDEASESFQDALAMIESSAALGRDDKEAQHEVMRLASRMANVYSRRGEHDEALKSAELCERAAFSIASGDEENVKAQADLWSCRQSLAEAHLRLGDGAEAIVRAEKGVEEVLAISERRAGTKGGRSSVGFAYMRLGYIYWQVGRADDAIETLNRAIVIFDSLSLDDPASRGYWIALAGCYAHLGDIHREGALGFQGSAGYEDGACWGEAVVYYERAESLMNELDSRGVLTPRYQTRLEEIAAKLTEARKSLAETNARARTR